MPETAFRDLVVFIQGRTWRDIIDILLVGFLAYRLLLLIRGTRAVQLLAGVGVLAVVGLAANALNLQLTSWIFSNLAPAVLIGVVILFQPELRRALDRVGRVGFLGRPLTHYNLQLASNVVEQAVRGVERLSQRRLGALIAFEREVGLENYALTGIRINADLTAEFLESIFVLTGPLHDGGAIVRGSQVVTAGCVFPLADELTVRSRIGTRHRAAIGLSLESDALVVIVSEETGRISVAQDGQLIEPSDLQHLRELLMNALVGRQSAERRLRLRFGRSPRSETTLFGPAQSHPPAPAGKPVEPAPLEEPKVPRVKSAR
jgi:diadenylate cyclase